MKELTFENGTPREVNYCDHEDVVDRPGANAFCRLCGEINPGEEAEVPEGFIEIEDVSEEDIQELRRQMQEAYE